MGTAIPLCGTFLLFMPYHLCSRLGIRMFTFIRQAYLLPLMLCVPMSAVLLLFRRWFVPHSYRQLIPQLLAGALAYGLGLAWAYWTDRALHVGDLTAGMPMVVGDAAPELPVTGAEAESYQEDV